MIYKSQMCEMQFEMCAENHGRNASGKYGETF